MKRVLLFAVTLIATTVALQAGPFTPGNLVVYRIGDGATPLTNSGNYAFLDEYTTNGTFVQSIALPQNQFTDTQGNVNYPIQNSGAATSEGMMTLSTDGRYLVFTGYGTNNSFSATTGGGNLTIGPGAFVPRVIGRADAKGNVDTTTALSNFTSGSGGNPRGVASTDGSNFWITGSSNSGQGVGYATLGSTTAVIIQPNNDRNIGIYNQRADLGYPPGVQQLYFTSSTRMTALGTNLPTAVVFNTNLVGIVTNGVGGIQPNNPLQSPYQFVALCLRPGTTNIDTVYIADEGVGPGATPNISKWAFNPVNSVWTNCGFINASALVSPCGPRSLTASVTTSGSLTNVQLYIAAGCGSGGGGSIYAVTDSSGYAGGLSGSLPSPLATASANRVFRGIAFAPADTLEITSIAKSGNDVPVAWAARGGRCYIVQSSNGNGNGSYDSTTFSDLSDTNFVLGYGLTTTNFVDLGGATNKPSRYYRVKLVGSP